MSPLGIALFLGFLVAVVFTQNNNEDETFEYMSTLSKYETFRGDIRDFKFQDALKRTPVQLWILHRHGTRLPDAGEIKNIESLPTFKEEIIKNHENGKGTLTDFQIEKLKQWTFDSSISEIPYYLTQEGYNETYRTASRFKQRFPELLNKEYSEEDFYFQHSDTQRTLKTSYAFINALFGDNAENYVNDVVWPSNSDFLLYPFGGACAKLTERLSSPNSYVDANAFLRTDAANQAIESISERLGFNETLSVDYIPTFFEACAYDTAWNQESQPLGAWCPALGAEGRPIGEYFSDLQFLAMSGYGNAVNERSGCATPKDLWERFATATGELNVEGKNHTVTALFSHDNLIMLALTSLGLNKDDPITSSDNYAIQANRKWRTSKIVPFAANIAAVLFEVQKRGATEYEVLFLNNEKPLEGIPNCPGGICSWEDFKAFVQPVADGCKFDDIC